MSSGICFAVRLGIYEREVHSIRDISIFISHIRFSLLLCIGIFYCLHRSMQKGIANIEKLFMVTAAMWFTFFLFVLESPTGIGLFIICAFFSTVMLIMRSKLLLPKIAMLVVVGGVMALSSYHLHNAYKGLLVEVPVDKSELATHTVYGNAYLHETVKPQTENGNRTWIYLCWEELDEEWPKRSSIDFDGPDKKGNEIKYTLIRYMTSKGLRKDAEGLASLSDAEIKVIENGGANANKSGIGNIASRTYQLVWEYRNYKLGGNPSGHSLAMRFEYWKASLHIINNSFWLGVGTGDLPSAFTNYYEESGSVLGDEWRRRAHNQYLAMMATFGVFGLIWFLLTLFLPPIMMRKFSDYHFLIFFIVAVVSMLSEDTIESQVGVTFFAYFNSLLLFARSPAEST